MPTTSRGRTRLYGGWAALALLLVVSVPARAQPPGGDLTRLSIEDLMNIEITSVSHTRQRVGDVAAAVSVITQDDIRRSGLRTIPELLRLVPGVHVARINANKWAVAVRGFNNLFASKVLVLINGRTTYDRLNSGVFWESLDIPLDQIERIEVVRGPGGATWGANATNGVINIVTMDAADLPGLAVRLDGGSPEHGGVAARYGGVIGAARYRVFSQWSSHGESVLANGAPANDRWQSHTHGFRLDWSEGRDTVMVEGGVTLARLRALWKRPSGPVPGVKPVFNELSYTREYGALARWTHGRTGGSTVHVQSSFNFRRNQDGASPTQISCDLEARYHVKVGSRHDVVVGGGYRLIDETVKGSFSFSVSPDAVTESVVNAFAQDEIALGSRVRLTLGAKMERDSYVGVGIQPTARVIWTLAPGQHLWTAVSRAIRTPSLGDLSVRSNFTSFIGAGGQPVVVGALGNPAFTSEDVTSVDAGYRFEVGARASVDVSAFRARYHHLKTSEPLAPRFESLPGPAHLFIPVQFSNLLSADTVGVEVTAHWTPAEWWRIDGGFSAFRLTPHLSPASRDASAATFDGNVPRIQWQARSAFWLPGRINLDLMVFHAGALRTLAVGAYTRADARLELPLTSRVSLAVSGQNLFDASHPEYAGAGAIVTPTEVARSGSLTLVWRQRP